jgi:serine/threonine-protein kinase
VLESTVALKIIRPDLAKDMESVNRFVTEAKAASAIGSTHIVQIQDFGNLPDGATYIVMEHLEGVTLGEALDKHPDGLTVDQALNVGIQVAEALSTAHAAGVVHRDLKPDNVFVAKDPGGNEVVKILDFGIAKVMDAAGGMGNKTRTGALIGTPGYMSPEQIKSAKNVDPRSDLWSVATILFQMLTGQLPFDADNDFTRLTAVIVGHPTPISILAPHLDRFTSFFDRALEKDPNKRFQTADEMAQVRVGQINPDFRLFGA